MILVYVGIVFVLVVVGIKGIQLYQRHHIKKLAHSLGIHNDVLVKDGVTYQVRYVFVPNEYTLKVNSPNVIEIKKGRDETRIQVDLNKPTCIITYPSKQKMLYTLNENEIDFFNFQKKIYQSYIVPSHHLKEFIEHA